MQASCKIWTGKARWKAKTSQDDESDILFLLKISYLKIWKGETLIGVNGDFKTIYSV